MAERAAFRITDQRRAVVAGSRFSMAAAIFACRRRAILSPSCVRPIRSAFAVAGSDAAHLGKSGGLGPRASRTCGRLAVTRRPWRRLPFGMDGRPHSIWTVTWKPVGVPEPNAQARSSDEAVTKEVAVNGEGAYLNRSLLTASGQTPPRCALGFLRDGMSASRVAGTPALRHETYSHHDIGSRCLQRGDWLQQQKSPTFLPPVCAVGGRSVERNEQRAALHQGTEWAPVIPAKASTGRGSGACDDAAGVKLTRASGKKAAHGKDIGIPAVFIKIRPAGGLTFTSFGPS